MILTGTWAFCAATRAIPKPYIEVRSLREYSCYERIHHLTCPYNAKSLHFMQF